MHQSIGQLLAEARERSEIRQRELAARLEIDPSRLSRIEKGEIRPDNKDVLRILDALQSTAAQRLRKFLKRKWVHLAQPSPWHPDIESLWEIERALELLASLDDQGTFPAVLRPQAVSLRDELLRSGSFLRSTDHSLSFMGGIGKGKTTTLCLLSELTVGGSEPPIDKVALEAAGGRTTLCEVQIRQGPQFGIIIEALSEREIYNLVNDFCAGVLAKHRGATGNEAEVGVSSEIDRVIRNMSGLLTRAAPKGSGSMRLDPIIELVSERTTVAELSSEIAKRLALWTRTEREIFYSGTTLSEGLSWIKDNFKLINKGRHPGFTIPRVITVLIPSLVLNTDGYNITLIDTKGIDETSVRSDLTNHIENPRTLSILCSSFNDAPDSYVTRILEQVFASGSNAIQRDRLMVLALPWTDQARKVTDETGEQPSSDEEGYEIKRHQVSNALLRLRAESIPIDFFNASVDDPVTLRRVLMKQLGSIRAKQAERVQGLVAAVDHLIEHQNEEKLKEAQRLVVGKLQRFIKRHEKLPERVMPAHQSLIDAFQEVSARSIWASTRRDGEWDNFSVSAYLGVGTQLDARARSEQSVSGLRELLDDMSADPQTESAIKFIDTARGSADGWYQDFLSESRHVGEETYKSALSEDKQLWSKCLDRWGQGGGYRIDVGLILRSWFEAPERLGLRGALENRLRAAWRSKFVGQIRKICEKPDGGQQGETN